MIQRFYATFASVFLICTFFSARPVRAQSLDSEEAAFLTLINAYRAQNGAGPLQISGALENSSRWMSTDMATKNYFSHYDSLGRDPFTRMIAFGYNFTPAGENIAGGNSTAQATLAQFQNACDPDSSGNCTFGHRQNMLYPGYKVIGIARVYNPSSTYRWYWTTDFGGVVDGPPPPTAPTIASFTASPSAIGAGQNSRLSWSITGATSISIDNGVGDVSSLTSQLVAPGQTTVYTITASNSVGSVRATAAVTVTGGSDNQAPSPPFINSSVAPNSNEVDLGWNASTDNVGVTGYRISRNGSQLANVSGSALSFRDTSVAANTYYTYSLVAFDAAGNVSNPSNTVGVQTPPAPSPSTPQSITAVSGGSQTATVNTAFASRLVVKVMDQFSSPMSGVMVTFTAPAGGAGATFSGLGNTAPVFTDGSGNATSPVLNANGAAGSYTIAASVAGISPARFILTNAPSVAPPPPAGGTSIWSGAPPPRIQYQLDGSAIELGVKFRSDVAGVITGVQFYKGARDSGSHTGSLWTSSGALLATGTFSNETGSGWQTLTFNTPIAISANTTYVASYHTDSPLYLMATGFFLSQGADSAPLHALQSGVDGPNGVYIYGAGGQFPSSSSFGTNFWVDVVFNSSGSAPTPSGPQSITAMTGSSQSANLGTAFAAQLQAKVLDGSGKAVAGVTVSFSAPGNGASVTFAGSGTMATAITDGAGVATSPTLTANNVAGTYPVLASVAGIAPASFSLTNKSDGSPPPSTAGAISIWPNDPPLPMHFTADGNPVELGVKFRSDASGRILGIRFYKVTRDNGTHTGSLWSSTGTLLATGTFSNETGSGWQTLTFSSPVAISANTTYVASYHTTSFSYAISLGYFANQGADNGALHALASGVDGPNGLMQYGPGGQFPVLGASGNNYWVDVVFAQ